MATLRERREAAQLTVEQLAHVVGVPARTVPDWEAGRATPDERQVGQLALALGLTPEEVRATLPPADDDEALADDGEERP